MASLKRGIGRAVPLGLRDRPPNTHARVVGRLGPEPDGGCGQPSTEARAYSRRAFITTSPPNSFGSEDRRLAPETQFVSASAASR